MLAKIARSLAGPLQLLPTRPHRHVWDDEHCVPAACTIKRCGRTWRPPWRERFAEWRDDLHDVFDTGD